jgi:hypothetical protein
MVGASRGLPVRHTPALLPVRPSVRYGSPGWLPLSTVRIVDKHWSPASVHSTYRAGEALEPCLCPQYISWISTGALPLSTVRIVQDKHWSPASIHSTYRG